MDGDRMGAWLAGGDQYAIPYRESFHPQVQGFDQHARREPTLRAYGRPAARRVAQPPPVDLRAR
jgi:CRISPR-associated protein Cmr2